MRATSALAMLGLSLLAVPMLENRVSLMLEPGSAPQAPSTTEALLPRLIKGLSPGEASPAETTRVICYPYNAGPDVPKTCRTYRIGRSVSGRPERIEDSRKTDRDGLEALHPQTSLQAVNRGLGLIPAR